MLELFKMQYLMKFIDSGQGGAKSLMTMFVLMGWDQFARYIPILFAALWAWAQIRFLGKKPSTFEQTLKDAPLLASPPPPTKSIRAFIQFERHQEKVADPRIDAVIHHVCNLPDVRSLRYNGVEMIPNFKDALMIDNDVWFEISNPNQQGSMSLMGPSTSSKDIKLEPILYRLSTYDHDITWLHKFVEQAMETFEQEKRNKLGSETYYFDQILAANSLYKGMCLFTKSKFTSNRTLNNVYLRQIGELQERVEFFMRRRDWYDSKGIPHTLGIVMYGHPGCGKTSTIKAIANQTKRHIFNIALSEIKTKEALKTLFYNDEVQVITNGKNEMLNIPLKHRLYVIEDIDAMNSVVIKRSREQQEADAKHKLKVEAEMELLKQQQGEMIAKAMVAGKTDSDNDKLDLATLLNVLDGVRETPGRIIILSTNYPERLDEALLRPGRFDMMLEFEKHSCDVLRQHIEKHYDITLTPKQLALVNTPSLNKKWTPAEVSQILFRRHTSPDDAIQDLLKEDPSKLFKFSQMKSGTLNDSERTVEIVEQEDAGTDLAKLLAEEETQEQQSENENEIVSLSPVSEETQKKEEESDDDIGPMSGGLSLVDPNPPTKEQIEAELKTHKVLFQEQYKDGVYIGPARYDNAHKFDAQKWAEIRGDSKALVELKKESEEKLKERAEIVDLVKNPFDKIGVIPDFLTHKSRIAEKHETLFNHAAAFDVASAYGNEPIPAKTNTYTDQSSERLHSIQEDFGLEAACSMEGGPCSIDEAWSGVCLSTEICAARDTTPLDLSRLGERAALLLASSRS